ncbi:MAG: T9SS type A sorting domain-containing protein [Bacteroidales bacterium]|jgi:hypothetical protein
MKKPAIILTVFIVIYSSNLFAQCNANAGPDKVVCVGNNGVEPVQIGGNPTAVAGTPPFTYTWEGKYQLTIGNLTFTTTASEILDDTTLANPTVINSTGLTDYFKLIVTVTDANSQVCKDTMWVRYSNFGYNLSVFIFSIQQGDSILLSQGSNVDGGIPPLQYLWRPNHGLTDSTHLDFWAKPQHSIDYYVTVTDAAGCSFEGPEYYWISVNPVGIETVNNSDVVVSISPNPARETIHFKINKENKGNLLLKIFDLSGRLLITETFQGNEKSVNVQDFKSGTYAFLLFESEVLLEKGTFMVE